MTPVLTDIIFRCPKCYGSNWHTASTVTMERKCDGCRFTWPESDDWRHFVHIQSSAFTSAKEYQNERGFQ